MKSRFLAIAAAAFCCLSCVEINYNMGGSLFPITEAYNVFIKEAPITDIQMKMADSLSGFSNTRVTIGAMRDAEFGLTTRSTALTLVPLFVDTLDLGKNPTFKNMFLQIQRDSSSVENSDQEVIFQNFNVYELEKPIDPETDYDCNSTIPHKNTLVSKFKPSYNGQATLGFEFTEDFGKRFLTIDKNDMKDIDTYMEKFPGIYIDCDTPPGIGGRINMFDLQMLYSSDYNMVYGNYAWMNFESEFDGERKDTTLLFMLGAYEFCDADSLFENASTYPQYAMNVTGHETRSRTGKAVEKIMVEGGGGLKPYISGKDIKKLAEKIVSESGADPKRVVINKAQIVLPFEFPENFKDVDQFWPDRLSPTVRIVTDTTTAFSSLTNTSDSDEDQGDINRSLCQYSPDITYHVQQLLRLDETDKESKAYKNFEKGLYDVWLLIMADEVYTKETETNDELSEYYNYLAYQSYYNGMYGGGSNYGSSYNNYYNYMMMANYASQSSTYEEIQTELDRDRFYRATLNGPAAPNGRVPKLVITFSVPKSEE